ncbi:MAG: methyltransferase domain-containing protein [Bacillus subtilis]|nr:methyltransferase domain-containing protein [Bacillus subtilis]
MKHLAFDGTETVIDGYCGVGITSLLLAKRARHVIGIDYSEPSIADATMNAKNNGIDNVRFIADRVEKALPGIIQKAGAPTSSFSIRRAPVWKNRWSRCSCKRRFRRLSTFRAIPPRLRRILLRCFPLTTFN